MELALLALTMPIVVFSLLCIICDEHNAIYAAEGALHHVTVVFSADHVLRTKNTKLNLKTVF